MIASLILTLAATTPQIKVIDFYGLRKVSRSRLEGALTIHEGDPLPDSKEAVEQQLADVPGVRAAHVGGTCCYEGGFVVWIGIEENGAPRLTFRPAPKGTAHLPADIDQSVDEFYVALDDAVRSGRDADDVSHGYSLIADPAARAIQERFLTYAKRDLPLLRKVLQSSASDRERAHAAQVIAYATDPRSVVPDLVAAVSDPSEDVRNAAIRALGVMAAYAQRNPGAGIHIPAQPFVKLLNSSVWSDRNKALMALMQVTADRDPAALAYLRREALPALIEAARWKLIGYAGSALYILGRIGGVPEERIENAVKTGDRDMIIAAAQRVEHTARGRSEH